MKVVVMEQRKKAASKQELRAALVEFQAQLEALYRRQRFKICRPKAAVRLSLNERKKTDLCPRIGCGGEDASTDRNR